MTLEQAISVEGRTVYSSEALCKKMQKRSESGYCKKIALLLMREIFNCTPREVGFRELKGGRNVYAFGAEVFEYRAEICRDRGDRAKLTAILRSSGKTIRIWDYEITGNTIKRI